MKCVKNILNRLLVPKNTIRESQRSAILVNLSNKNKNSSFIIDSIVSLHVRASKNL